MQITNIPSDHLQMLYVALQGIVHDVDIILNQGHGVVELTRKYHTLLLGFGQFVFEGQLFLGFVELFLMGLVLQHQLVLESLQLVATRLADGGEDLFEHPASESISCF